MALPAHRFAEISYLARFSEAAAYAIPTSLRGFDYLGRACRHCADEPPETQ